MGCDYFFWLLLAEWFGLVRCSVLPVDEMNFPGDAWSAMLALRQLREVTKRISHFSMMRWTRILQ